jgi:hypothetical protein
MRWCLLYIRTTWQVGFCLVLAHWNNSAWIDMLFLLINNVCLAEMQQTPILSPLVWLNRGSNIQSPVLESNSLTITPSMQFLTFWYFFEFLRDFQCSFTSISFLISLFLGPSQGWLVGLWCLMPLSTIFQLYRGGRSHRK